MSEHILKATAGGVLTLTFNRPDKKNAITDDMYAAMAEALDLAEREAAVRVVVITGTGDAFTAGNDLKDFLDNPPADDNAHVFQFMYALADFPKPVVAGVNGLAIGIGTTLLLHVDFAYAVPEARFALPFVNLALVPEFGSSLLLPQFMGTRKATELLMTSDMFDAETALSYGLINAVVPTAQLMEQVRTRAASLAEKPPQALKETKRLLRADVDKVTDRIRFEAQAFGERLKSTELKEAIAAFFEKRPPNFSKS
jgi:enoyl-CoA hydratase/carnithine racemase